MQRSYQLTQSSEFSSFEPALQRLLAVGNVRQFENGEFIFQQGETADGIVIVVSGAMAVGRYRHDGTYNLLTVMGPGELSGDMAYFAGILRQNDGMAEGSTAICFVPGRAIDQLIDTDPQVSRLMLRSMSGQMARMIRTLDAERRHPARIRLGWMLLQQCSARDGLFDGSQQDLANLLGVSRVSLVSALSALVELGFVRRGYRKLWLTDRDGLQRWLAKVAGPANPEP